MDLGILSAFSSIAAEGGNDGWRMENLVFLKLYADHSTKDYELFYWKNGCEVDFVLARKQRVLKLIQVAYDLSNAKTRQREINGLLQASSRLSCDDLSIVTLTEKATLQQDGKTITICPITEFLMEE